MIMIISLTAWYFFFAGMTAEIFLGSTTTTQHRWGNECNNSIEMITSQIKGVNHA